MKRAVFESLAEYAVGHACFEPMIPVYRQALCGQSGPKAREAQTAFYQSLTSGQRALFLFFTYYDHAVRSVDEFQRISQQYLSDQIFGAVQKGAEYFHDDEMRRLLLQIEQTLLPGEPDRMPGLYRQLRAISPHTLAIIAATIRENPAEYLCLEPF